MEHRAEPPDQPAEEPQDDGPASADLVTIGLAAFFVSLIAIVGALLVLPAVF